MDRTSDLRGEQDAVHSTSGMTRRAALKAAVLGGLSMQVPTAAQALIAQPTLRLSNGLRIHLSHNRSGYVSAALVLRAKEIAEPRGLAHIMEHTSFTGAAGSLTAREVKALHSDCIQESNATTGRGMIEWNATFLPKYTSEVLDLLAITSLDQKFDVETVASEARVVLQELYLDKYDAKGRAKQQFEAALYGPSHPYAHDTTETEIAAARTPPPRLAAELTQYSQRLKLPANMDLFLVGEFDPGSIGEMVRKSFGRFAFAEGAEARRAASRRDPLARRAQRRVEGAPAPHVGYAHRLEYGRWRHGSACTHIDGARRVSQQGAVLRAQGEVRRQLHAGSQPSTPTAARASSRSRSPAATIPRVSSAGSSTPWAR